MTRLSIVVIWMFYKCIVLSPEHSKEVFQGISLYSFLYKNKITAISLVTIDFVIEKQCNWSLGWNYTTVNTYIF